MWIALRLAHFLFPVSAKLPDILLSGAIFSAAWDSIWEGVNTFNLSKYSRDTSDDSVPPYICFLGLNTRSFAHLRNQFWEHGPKIDCANAQRNCKNALCLLTGAAVGDQWRSRGEQYGLAAAFGELLVLGIWTRPGLLEPSEDHFWGSSMKR